MVVLGLGVLMAIVWAGAGAPGAHSQEWGAAEPGQGKPGTMVTIGGNLIGCYANGPGELSSTWGWPDEVAFYWNPKVLDPEAAKFLPGDLQVDSAAVLKGMTKIASHSFGDARWSLTFAIPGDPPGPHYGVLAFEPQCNYKSVEKPDGFTDKPSVSVVQICILDASGACPAATAVGTAGGSEDTSNPVGTVSKVDEEYEYHKNVTLVSGGLILLLGGWAAYGIWTGGLTVGAGAGAGAAGAGGAGAGAGAGVGASGYTSSLLTKVAKEGVGKLLPLEKEWLKNFVTSTLPKTTDPSKLEALKELAALLGM